MQAFGNGCEVLRRLQKQPRKGVQAGARPFDGFPAGGGGLCEGVVDADERDFKVEKRVVFPGAVFAEFDEHAGKSGRKEGEIGRGFRIEPRGPKRIEPLAERGKGGEEVRSTWRRQPPAA